jgi:ATP-dependent exoDNAse (exonuclease V) beta subunit
LNPTTANFTVYNSSAGSGKTFTLVKEYLKIALKTKNEKTFKGILAITFTNKAAAEMKERVIDALKALSGQTKLEGTPKHLLEALIKPIEEDGLGISQEEIKLRSRAVLSSILHNYNDFAISTIDKFTTKIIRTFALDLKLPLNFGIELNEDEVLKSAVDMLIAEVGVNEKLTKLLIDYSKEKADDEKSWNIELDLIKFAKNITKEGGEAHLEKIRNLSIDDFESIKKELIVSKNTFEHNVKDIGKRALDFINQQGIEHASFSSSYIPTYFNYLSTFRADKLIAGDSVQKMFRGEKDLYSKATPQAQKGLIDSNKSEITAFYTEIEQLLTQSLSDYILKGLLLKTIYQTAVINEIEKTILEFKADNNILNLSDFNKQIAKIILTESIPFIYERLGEKYHHYLIDEFQDTSIIQWQNLLPLIENALGNGNYNMLVGDAKQSIYRFRGGEVEQIMNLPRIYQHNNNPLLVEREQALVRNHKNENLTQNYRSKAEIVEFNNQFFNFIANELSEKFSGIYSELKQEFDTKNTGGGISISFLEPDDYKANTNLKIKETIEQCLADGYQYSDITILTRSNDNASAIASFLLENNIQVISSESLLLNNSNEVKFLLSLFKYIANPSDLANHLYAINYLINTQFTNEENIDYFIHKAPDVLGDFLRKHDLTLSTASASTFSLYELTEYLIEHFELSKNVNIFIQFFLDKVHEYATKNDNSILNFVEWWDNKSKKFSVVIPNGINAVQVMTIHKSKGLEFPVVIYPFATNNAGPTDSFIWTEEPIVNGLDASILKLSVDMKATVLEEVYNYEKDKEKLDTINVLYVALTRPKNRLYIVSKQKETKGEKPTKNYFLDFCLANASAKVTDSHYVFGEFKKATHSTSTENSENEVMNNMSYNPWRSKIAISYQAPKYWDIENPETYADYGNLIHQLLSEIEHLSDADKVIATFTRNGLLKQEQKDQVVTQLNEILAMPEVVPFFTDYTELKTETTILLPTGESYQPDRVVIKNNTTFILDYKTGKKEKKHHEQLEQYRLLLAEMGYTNIKCYLLYIKEKELVEVKIC